MKQTLLFLSILSSVTLYSCRKDKNNQDIKQYDQSQIMAYIAANGITGMKRDTSGGDTSGIYYQVITPGKGKRVDYPDSISFVYTLKSFDGKFSAPDTIINHFDGLLGHLSPDALLIAMHNLVKNKGGRIRVLAPSHLAFGVNGSGTGSKTLTTSRIAGNQCLDYYINLLDDQSIYDDLVIQNYIKRSNLTGYNKTADGVYYKIVTAGTGTSPIVYYSTVTATYQGQLLNGTIFDQNFVTTSTTFNMTDIALPGLIEAFESYAVAGTSISVIIPSKLAYGVAGAGTTIPVNSCLRFDYQISAVSP